MRPITADQNTSSDESSSMVISASSASVEESAAHTALAINNEAEDNNQEIIIQPPERPQSLSIISRSMIMGASQFLVAVYFVGNGFILSRMGPTEAAAASLIGTIQSVGIGTGIGFMMGTNVELATVLGRRDKAYAELSAALQRGDRIKARATQQNINECNRLIGDIIKSSWIMSALIGTATASFFALGNAWLPSVVSAPTAEATNQFFRYYLPGAASDVIIINNGFVMFQLGGWRALLAATASYRFPALALSYLLGEHLHYGAAGVGAGASIASILTLLWTIPWFRRAVYRQYNLFNGDIQQLRSRLSALASNGWKLGLQRITEWVNLAAIALLIGAWSNDSLIAIQPSNQVMTMFNLFSQGMAQAVMMYATRDGAAMRQHLERFEATFAQEELEEYRRLHASMARNFYRSNLSGAALNSLIATAVCLAREPISHLFIPANVSNGVMSLSNTLLIVNAISLIADSLRIISSGALRGWGDLLYPTIASLIAMTLVGFPITWGISAAESENVMPIFIGRNIAILASVALNLLRFYQHRRQDQITLTEAMAMNELHQLMDTWNRASGQFLLEDENFLSRITSYGLSRIDIGSFFNVLAPKLAIDETSLRNDLCREIVKNNGRYLTSNAPDLAALIRTLNLMNSSSLEILARAAAQKYNINLVIINDSSEIPTVITKEGADQTIYLCNENNTRFSLLVGQPTPGFCAQLHQAPLATNDRHVDGSRSSMGWQFFRRARPQPERVEQVHLLSPQALSPRSRATTS